MSGFRVVLAHRFASFREPAPIVAGGTHGRLMGVGGSDRRLVEQQDRVA